MQITHARTPPVLVHESACDNCGTCVSLTPPDLLRRDDQREGMSFEWRCPTCGSRCFVRDRDILHDWVRATKEAPR